MKGTRVALRYAKSLLSLADERNILEQVKDDMLALASVFEENTDFRDMLKSPVVKSDRKAAILKQVFEKEVCELSMKFINLVLEKRREAILGAIANSFIDLYNDLKNIVKATVVTANAITEDTRNKVLSQLKLVAGDANILIEEQVDESIIGGFVLRIGDTEYNASIANKLQQLKREFVSNPYLK
jgi:F-type H+-transporting ATPase subunit delta